MARNHRRRPPKAPKPAGMHEWRVSATVRGSKYIGSVLAPTPEAALDAAADHEGMYVSLCHQCSGQCSDPEIDGYVVEREVDGEWVTAEAPGYWEDEASQLKAQLEAANQRIAELEAALVKRS